MISTFLPKCSNQIDPDSFDFAIFYIRLLGVWNFSCVDLLSSTRSSKLRKVDIFSEIVFQVLDCRFRFLPGTDTHWIDWFYFWRNKKVSGPIPSSKKPTWNQNRPFSSRYSDLLTFGTKDEVKLLKKYIKEVKLDNWTFHG